MQSKSLLPFIIIIAVITTPLFATIWRVDNKAGAAGDFTTLQAAESSTEVQDGDTLYVYGSSISYYEIILDRPLVIIGPGYFLDQNPETQAYPALAIASTITFNPGSEHSVITGLSTARIDVNANNITIKRMRISSGSHLGSIYVSNTYSATTIQQCYITNSYGNSESRGIWLAGNNTSIIIDNNYMDVNYNTGKSIDSDASSAPAHISHNVLSGNVVVSNTTFENNILRDGTASFSNTTVLNNICNETQFDTTGSNQQNVDMNTVFMGSGSYDGRWQLAAGSPALGAGTEGTDCGMFGGSAPYVLSGIPTIPHIYYLTVPSAAEPGALLQVRVKAKTSN
ncbi:right-handed parallel beta-helix repeat-containing protein [Candidatus Neomarinimicrobiota bacterium]